MGQVVPIVIHLMMNDYPRVWGEACYPAAFAYYATEMQLPQDRSKTTHFMGTQIDLVVTLQRHFLLDICNKEPQ